MTIKAKKLKSLVTGASGFIGYEVSRQLSRDGYRPRLMIRQPGDDCEICRFDADITLADLKHPDSLRQAVKGVDGIIHLGARATFESYIILKPSILDGSIALMEAGIEAGVRRFVYSSSLLVYSGQASPVTADTQVNPLLDYGRIKVDTERRLSAMAASAGVAFTALRLPHVYGVRDLYFRHLQGGRLPSAWATFLEIVRQHYPNARVLMFPQRLAPLATALLTPFRRIRPNPGLETPGAVRSYNFNLAVDPDLLWQDLGLAPRYETIYDGIPAAVASTRETEILTTRLR